MKKVIVTGATGLLGREIVKALRATGRYEVLGTAFSRAGEGTIKLDLRDGSASAHMVIEAKPDIVINAAAERRPDVCEADDLGSESLNIESVWHLGRSASYVRSNFIHISTDYIFDGAAAPYKEDAKPNPLNAYGRQKLRGEYAALAAHGNALILRLPVLFGPTADVSESAITVFANAVRDHKAPKVLDDWQIRVPTFTPDIAATLVNICDAMTTQTIATESLSGIFHYSSEDCLTRYKVAQLIGEVLGLPTDHISSDPKPPAGAPRPRDAKLDTAKLRTLGLASANTSLRDALKLVLNPTEKGIATA